MISNDINNTYSDLITIVPITTQTEKVYPFEVLITKDESGLKADSKIKCNQIRTIDKIRLSKKVGSIDKNKINQIEKAVCIHLDINF